MLDLAIVGLGSWGRRLVESVQGRSDAVRFTAAATRTPAKAEAFAAAHGLRITDDLGAVLAGDAVGGVVVAGPAPLHAEHAMAALDAGKPVLAVKPMALRRADAEALQAKAEARGQVLAMGYNRCFLPAMDVLRRRVANGDLGRIVHAEGNFCVDRYFNLDPASWKADITNAPPGSLADHMLYAMIELLGPVAEVHAQGLRQVVSVSLADTSAVLLRFAAGQGGLLTAIGVTAPFFRLQLFGTEGWAELRGSDRLTFRPRAGEESTETSPPFEAERAELEAFAAAVAGERAFPVTPEQAVHGVAVIEAMGESAAAGRPVTVA